MMQMKTAHFRIKENQQVVTQSIKAHLEATSVLSERFAAKIHMPNTGKLLGILHDSGKYSKSYQGYLEQCRQYELGIITNLPQRGSVDHGVFGAVYVMEELCSKVKPKEEAVANPAAEIAAMIIASHHGGLRDYLSPDTSTPLWSRMKHYMENKQEEYQETKTVFEQEFSRDMLMALFYDAVEEIKKIRTRILSSNPSNAQDFFRFQLHLVIKFLYSCLIDADREDTRRFMEGTEEVKNVIAENGIKENETETGGEERAHRTSWKTYEQHMNACLKEFHDKPCRTESERTIRRLREEISDTCYQAGAWPSGVYKLTVPTGGGKTLAGIRFALRHMQNKANGDSGHVFQFLPFTAIIEQNADAVRHALQCRDDLLEHHSNVIFDYNASAKGEEDEDYNISRAQYRLLTERWDARFVFSTTVQFLNTVYASGTQNIRRMHNLANSVIIMDEIQALPLRTMKLFGELVSFLALVCNTTILLCTATQPNLERLRVGIPMKVKEIIPNLTETFEQFQRMEVVDKTRDGGYTVDEAVCFIEEIKAQVQSLLIVMNTKKITREIYDALKKNGSGQTEVIYITTELCPAHRNDVIAHIKELLVQKKPVICVSTSILEAGVDISFESVIRNIAGLDSIAQSSGRGNRHGEHARPGFTYIINMAGEILGSMLEIEKGEEKTKAVLDTYRRNPKAYSSSLLSPAALSDYYQKYFTAGEIDALMDYPILGDPELKDLYSYFTRTGNTILRQRYRGRHHIQGDYPWMMTYPLKTAAEKFRVIDQETVSVLVPYGKGKELIGTMMKREGRMKLGELNGLLSAARPYIVNIYTNRLWAYRDAVLTSPLPGVLLLREGYYDDITGIKEEQTLEFLSL